MENDELSICEGGEEQVGILDDQEKNEELSFRTLLERFFYMKSAAKSSDSGVQPSA